YTAIRPYGDTAIRPYGDTAIRPYGDTAIRPYGYTDSRGARGDRVFKAARGATRISDGGAARDQAPADPAGRGSDRRGRRRCGLRAAACRDRGADAGRAGP